MLEAGVIRQEVPTCFVFVGHGIQPDVVEPGAGVLVQQGAELKPQTSDVLIFPSISGSIFNRFSGKSFEGRRADLESLGLYS